MMLLCDPGFFFYINYFVVMMKKYGCDFFGSTFIFFLKYVQKALLWWNFMVLCVIFHVKNNSWFKNNNNLFRFSFNLKFSKQSELSLSKAQFSTFVHIESRKKNIFSYNLTFVNFFSFKKAFFFLTFNLF